MSLSATTAYQLYKLGQFGSTLLLGVVLARLWGNGAQLQQYEQALFYAGAVSTPLVFGLGNLFQQQYVPGQGLRSLWGQAMLLGLLAAVLASGLAWGVGLLPLPYLLPVGLLALGTVGGLQLEYLWLKQLRGGALLGLGIVFFGANMAAVLLPLRWGLAPYYSIGGLAGVAMLRLGVYSLLCWQHRQPSSTGVWRLFWPLLGSALVLQGALQVEGVLVQLWDGAHFVLYRYAARELPVTLALATALSAAFAGHIDTRGGADTGSLMRQRQLTRRLLHQVFPLTMGLIVAGPWLFRLVYGPGFEQAGQVFTLYLLLVIPRTLFPQAILTGLKQNNTLFRTSVMEMLVHLALICALLPWLGYVGAGIATLLSHSAEKAILIHRCQKQGIHVEHYTPLRLWAVYSLATVVLWVLANALYL